MRGWLESYRRFLKDDTPSVRVQRLVLAAIVGACLLIRIATINNPPLDRTAWKEIDYLAVAHNYDAHGFHFWNPEVSWPADPPHRTGMEFPIVPFLTAGLFAVAGEHPMTARAVPLISWLALIVGVFLLARREFNPTVGLVAAAASGALPLAHPFGRLLLSEPTMIALAVIALYSLAEWLDHGRRVDGWLGGIALSLAIATKLEVLYIALPLAYLGYRRYQTSLRSWRPFLLIVGASLLLPIAWYAWAYHLELTGVKAFSVFTGHDKLQTLTMLRDAYWYRTMVRERLVRQLLDGPIGVALAGLGAIVTMLVVRRRAGLFIAWALALLLYVGIVAEGQLDAPYRQLSLVPVFAVLIALGSTFLAVGLWAASHQHGHDGIASLSILGVGVFLCALIPLRYLDAVRGSRDPSVPLRWDLAQQLRRVTQPGDTIAVAGEYDPKKGGNDLSPVLYYYSGLRGWTLQHGQCALQEVQHLARLGASFFVSVPTYSPAVDAGPCAEANHGQLALLRGRYRTVIDEPSLLVLDLKRPAT